MELRHHPLMSCQQRPSWPPVWAWIGGKEDQYIKGELGVLKELRIAGSSDSRFYLLIEHNDRLYMGSLQFDDKPFCRRIFDLLQNQIGRSIQEIGSLKIDKTES